MLNHLQVVFLSPQTTNHPQRYERSIIGQFGISRTVRPPKDVKPYLDEFLMDERVIDTPKWLRNIIVRGNHFATPAPKNRPKPIPKFGGKKGRRLIVISERFTEKVQKADQYARGPGYAIWFHEY